MPSRPTLLLPVLLLASAALTTIPLTAMPVSGQLTGVVCVSKVTGSFADSCAPNHSSINAHDKTVTVSVNIEGSQGFNGFTISVRTDSRFLLPTSFNVTGTVLETVGTPSIIFSCVNGVGTACIVDIDGPGVVSLTLRAPPGTTTSTPTTGRLFTITYNVIASPTGPLGTPIFFPGPCLAPFGTSVPGRCIDIFSPIQIPVPETDQQATFR